MMTGFRVFYKTARTFNVARLFPTRLLFVGWPLRRFDSILFAVLRDQPHQWSPPREATIGLSTQPCKFSSIVVIKFCPLRDVVESFPVSKHSIKTLNKFRVVKIVALQTLWVVLKRFLRSGRVKRYLTFSEVLLSKMVEGHRCLTLPKHVLVHAHTIENNWKPNRVHVNLFEFEAVAKQRHVKGIRIPTQQGGVLRSLVNEIRYSFAFVLERPNIAF